MRKFIISILAALFFTISFAQDMQSYGPTTKADQLWQIAIIARPNASVSIQQTMVAILKTNPDAFDNNNINYLKPNIILNIPSLGEIKQIDFKEAAKIIAEQDKTLQKPLPKKTIIANKKNQQQLITLQNQFNNIGKLLQAFDQQYQQRINDTEEHDLDLQNKIDKIDQEINDINIIINKMQTPQKSKISEFLSTINLPLSMLDENTIKLLAKTVIILLFLLILLIAFKRRLKKKKLLKQKKQVQEQENDTDSEYDFLGSKEGIPAKLDLARAYIDMGDKESAKNVLREVLELGDEKQKAEAKNLLEEISK